MYQKNDDALTIHFRPYIERLLTALYRLSQMEPDHEGLLDESDSFMVRKKRHRSQGRHEETNVNSYFAGFPSKGVGHNQRRCIRGRLEQLFQTNVYDSARAECNVGEQ